VVQHLKSLLVRADVVKLTLLVPHHVDRLQNFVFWCDRHSVLDYLHLFLGVFIFYKLIFTALKFSIVPIDRVWSFKRLLLSSSLGTLNLY
jgi:hypothetical protein